MDWRASRIGFQNWCMEETRLPKIPNKASQLSLPIRFVVWNWIYPVPIESIQQYDFDREDHDMFRQTLFRDSYGFCQFPPMVPAEFLPADETGIGSISMSRFGRSDMRLPYWHLLTSAVLTQDVFTFLPLGGTMLIYFKHVQTVHCRFP